MSAELTRVARLIEDMKQECGMDPETPTAIRNSRLMSIAAILRALASSDSQWIAVAERMPEAGLPVLASLLTPHKNRRVTIRAHYAPLHTVDASHWEDGATDDTESGSYEPEGWWEDPYIGERLEFVGASDGEVTHWMPLPDSSALAA